MIFGTIPEVPPLRLSFSTGAEDAWKTSAGGAEMFGAVVLCQVVGSARETLCFVGFLVVFKVDWMLF